MKNILKVVSLIVFLCLGFVSKGQAPVIQVYNPDRNLSGVTIDQILTLDFDMNIQFGTGTQVIRLRRVSDGTVFQSYSVDGVSTDGNLSINNSTLTINHSDFEYNTAYYVTISNGAIESTGGTPFAGLSLATDWAFTTVVQAPSVVTLLPTNNATDVAVDQTVSVTFDQNIQFGPNLKTIRIRRTADNSVFQSYIVEGGLTDPTLSISGATLTIAHNDFEENTQYYITIDSGAIQSTIGVDFGGFSLTTDWTFTTVAAAPIVQTYNPVKDAVGVAIDQVLTLDFDMNIQFGAGPQVIRLRKVSDGSIFQSFTVDGGSTDGNLSISNSTLTINHSDFEYNTAYYVTISNGAIESTGGIPFAGFSLANDWAFTTVVQAPSVITLLPTNSATDIAVDQTVSVTFDQNIQFGPNLKTIRIRRTADNSLFQSYIVEGGLTDPTLSISGATLTIAHNDFEENTQYYVTIDSGAIQSTGGVDFGGFSLVTDWTFTTVAAAPVVQTYNPIKDAVGVAIDQVLTLDFDMNIQFGAGPQAIRLRRVSDGSVFQSFTVDGGSTDGNLSISNSTLTINHTDFEYNTAYYVTISNGAIESTGGIPFTGFSLATDWAFTTVVQAPAVLTLLPDNNATDVAVDQTVSITFDQNIQFNSALKSIRIRRTADNSLFQSYLVEGGLTDPTLSISGATLIIAHNDFEENTQYYITIESGAIQSTGGVDFGGFSLVTDWTFTTVAAAPVVQTYNPVKDAVGVAIDQVLTLDFDMNIQFGAGPQAIRLRRVSDGSIFQSFTVDGGSTDVNLSISNSTLTINHTDFEYNTAYYVTISNGAIESTGGISFAGFSLATDWAFTTDVQAPAVLTLLPTNNATNVAVDQTVSITFDQNIQFNSALKSIRIRRTSDNSTFQSYLVEGGLTDPTLSISGATLTIAHNDFEENTQYYITIESGAIQSTGGVDFGGFSLVTDWTFTSVAAAPVVQTYNPVKDAVGVAIDQVLTLDFDMNIQFGAGPQVIRLRRVSDGSIFQSFTVDGGSTDVNLSISNTTLTINHTDFEYNTAYYVTISNGAIESTGGIPFAGFSLATDWAFTTDVQAPAVLTLLPTNNEIDVAVDQTVSITFDQNIQFSSALKSIRIRRTSDNSTFQSYLVEGGLTDPTLSISGATLTIAHNDFEENTQYYILIDDGAIQSTSGADFAGFSTNTDWTFTTLINIPITTFDPVNGATAINIQTNVVATYDQAIRQVGGAEITDPATQLNIGFTHSTGSVSFTASINATKDVITIVPDADLLSNTQYTITIDAVENASGNAQTGQQTTVFTTDNFVRWNGSESSDPSDDRNWDEQIIGSFSAIIPASAGNMPVISTYAEIENVIVEAGANISITGTGTLSIDGLLELQSSNVSNVGNGTLVNLGTLTMGVSSEVKIHQQISSEPYDYYISSPVANATPQNIGVNGEAYRFVPNTKWVLMGMTEQFNAAEGYSVWSTAGTDLVFSGAINDEDSYLFNCERATTPYNNYGWNLMGNPYPAAINWDALTVSPEMNNHFYVRLNDTGQFGVYNESGSVNLNPSNASHIPSLQSVWVQVKIAETTGSITIPKGSQRDSRYTYLKSAKNSAPAIRLSGLNAANHKDELLIAFNSEVNHDAGTFKSEKRFISKSTSSIVELYTINADEELAIDTYEDYSEGQAVSLGYKTGVAGKAYIELSGIEYFTDDVEVKIEDLYQTTMTPLALGEKYEFDATVGQVDDRFIVHIAPAKATSIEEGVLDDIKIYDANGNIYIKLPQLTNTYAEIYDLGGRQLYKTNISPGLTNKVVAPSKGVIIVKVISKEGVFTQKLLIK